MDILDRLLNLASNRSDYSDRTERFNTFAASCGIEYINRKIVDIRDGVRRTPDWDPVDTDDNEIDAVRGILLECASDFASLIQEWRFYILSIGRDRYIETAS